MSRDARVRIGAADLPRDPLAPALSRCPPPFPPNADRCGALNTASVHGAAWNPFTKIPSPLVKFTQVENSEVLPLLSVAVAVIFDDSGGRAVWVSVKRGIL